MRLMASEGRIHEISLRVEAVAETRRDIASLGLRLSPKRDELPPEGGPTLPPQGGLLPPKGGLFASWVFHQ